MVTANCIQSGKWTTFCLDCQDHNLSGDQTTFSPRTKKPLTSEANYTPLNCSICIPYNCFEVTYLGISHFRWKNPVSYPRLASVNFLITLIFQHITSPLNSVITRRTVDSLIPRGSRFTGSELCRDWSMDTRDAKIEITQYFYDPLIWSPARARLIYCHNIQIVKSACSFRGETNWYLCDDFKRQYHNY